MRECSGGVPQARTLTHLLPSSRRNSFGYIASQSALKILYKCSRQDFCHPLRPQRASVFEACLEQRNTLSANRLNSWIASSFSLTTPVQ